MVMETEVWRNTSSPFREQFCRKNKQEGDKELLTTLLHKPEEDPKHTEYHSQT
jgi:hypothetical protein